MLLTVPKNIENVSYVNDTLILRLSGNQVVKFVIKKTQLKTLTTSMLVTTASIKSSTSPSFTRMVSTASTTKTSTIMKGVSSAISSVRATSTKQTISTLTSLSTVPKKVATKTSVSVATATKSLSYITSATTTSKISSKSSPSTSSGRTTPYAYTLTNWIYIIAAMAISIGVIIALLLRRKASMKSELESLELSPLDKDIINELSKSGGALLQSELQRRLRVPRTTLWRHIRKLERLGYVEVIKEGGYNKVVLKRYKT